MAGGVVLLATGKESVQSNFSEIIDLSSATTCDISSYHFGLSHAASGYLDKKYLTICGGYEAGAQIKSCYTYDLYGQSHWTFLRNMMEERTTHAIATLPDGKLWITGTY